MCHNNQLDTSSVSIRKFVKYLKPIDYLLFGIGVLATWVAGFNWPLLTIFFGKTVDVFVDYANWYNQNWNNETISSTERELHRMEYMNKVFWISGATCVVFVLGIFSTFISLIAFQRISLNIVNKMKQQYFRSVLWQDIAWFDHHQSGEFASSISSDFQKIEKGLNENLCLLIYNLSSAFIHLAIGYYYGWKLALITSTIGPVMILGAIITTKLQSFLNEKQTKYNTLASSVAEEAISGIRTVFAFNGQQKEIDRYDSKLTLAMKFGCRRNFVQGISLAIHWGCVYMSLAYGLWYGVQLIVSENYTVGNVVIVFWLVSGCAFCIGYAAPYFEAFQIGKSSAKTIFDVIERKSLIDSSNESEGTRLLNYRSNIEFRNVHFNYPSRKNVPILKGLNLKINQNEIVALVGPSGCGKSTTFQLLQRMYDPNQGKIYLDNIPIDTLNIGWLREQFGTVGQEPILFDTTIAENIRLGANHDQMNQITQTDIENAAKEANAHEFIISLEKGYKTYVGDGGAQLSGGQKQRIAIARALISKPKILLLDEATSALDLESEQIVQTALDRASKNCTTIIIAHRLSTIINANRIIYIENGQVVEEGTHETLMEKKGKYYSLVQAQQVMNKNSDLINKAPMKISLVKQELSDSCSSYRKHSQTTTSDISNAVIKLGNTNTFKIMKIDEQQKKELKKIPFDRIWKLIWLDKWLFIIAMITALVYGMTVPLYALFFGDFVNIFAKTQDNEEIKSQTLVYSYMFAGLAVSILIFCTIQVSLFGICGERLAKRLRLMAYTAILKKDIPFFDKQENSSGALCARLANDAANVQGATGLRISMLCQFISSILFSLAIGFTFNWRLGITSIILIPALAVASMIGTSVDKIQKSSKSSEKSSKTIIEAINAIRTVVSLNKQKYFYNKLNEYLQEHYRLIRMRLMLKSFIFSLAIYAPFLAYSIMFLYGGYLVSYGLLQVGDFFKIMECIIFGAMVAGQSTVLSADFARARLAAINIFKLIDENVNDKYKHTNGVNKLMCNNSNGLEQVVSTNGKSLINANRSKGNITFKDVHFTYPEREENTILNGLSFTAQQGQTVAIVGSSGCGKSTSIQLLERFYNCHKGKVLLDGKDIAEMDINWLRSQMSLVSQEPILFSYSIRENIAYGDNSRTITIDEIQRVAKMANVHDFITKLPNSYDTPVGSKGAQLSGGQKQRIAIARALIRDPPILLLDEATSALDTESEQLVQKSLDEASKNRTCLIIAHRLKTIVNADKIIVIKKGQNVEEGTHEELLAREGQYWKLYNKSK